MERLPWHVRRAGTEHLKWFQNLVDQHELTRSWIEDLKISRASNALTRGLSKEATENLWMLESLSDARLEEFLDDTSPDDLLGRLDHTVWAAQAATLQELFAKTTDPDALRALVSTLEQSSFKHGRRICETRWGSHPQLGNMPLPTVLAALWDSPFSGFPRKSGILNRRVTDQGFDVLWRASPYQSPYPEVRGIADHYCEILAQSVRGYVYVLNHHALLECVKLSNTECALQCSRVSN